MDGSLVALSLGQLAFIGFIIWVIVYSRAKKARLKSEERLRVLERFNSSEELNEFFKTDSGREFLHLFAPPSASSANPHHLILGAVALGILTIFGGAGFALLMLLGPQHELADVFPVSAALLLTCGVGVLVAAVVSLFLARAWDLVKKPRNGD